MITYANHRDTEITESPQDFLGRAGSRRCPPTMTLRVASVFFVSLRLAYVIDIEFVECTCPTPRSDI